MERHTRGGRIRSPGIRGKNEGGNFDIGNGSERFGMVRQRLEGPNQDIGRTLGSGHGQHVWMGGGLPWGTFTRKPVRTRINTRDFERSTRKVTRKAGVNKKAKG
jgi:hypothetical protein